MDRKLVSLVLAVAVAAAGSLAAHVVAYALVARDVGTRQDLLDGTGHRYLEHQGDFFAALIALAAVSLMAVVVLSRRGSRLWTPPAWPFALAPLVGFPVQEHAERWLHEGAFPQDAVSSRLFVLGLALQVPFALLGWLAARCLFAVARSVGTALARTCLPVSSRSLVSWPRSDESLPALAISHGGVGSRAPPLSS